MIENILPGGWLRFILLSQSSLKRFILKRIRGITKFIDRRCLVRKMRYLEGVA
jgi:hypothetical protein